jgi:SAM-dependent methyltransferase
MLRYVQSQQNCADIVRSHPVTIERTERSRNAVRIDSLADLVTPMAIRAAASLRLAEHIDQGVRTVAEMAARTGAHRASLTALVNHLVAIDVLACQDDGLYLTRLGKQLKIAQRYLDIENSVGRSELALVRLLDAVKDGHACYPLQFGCTFWEDLAANQRLRASFDEMTDQHLETEIGPLLAAYDWSSVRHFVDLGSGNGAFPIRLLTEFGHLTGTILELAGRIPVTQRNLAAANLANRCTVVAGSFFESLEHLPHGTYMLCSVLHDWSDDDTAKILRRCAEALYPDGRLLIIDSFTEAGNGDTDMDLRMLALFGGRQRSLADMASMAADSGLRVAVTHKLRKKWLLELIHDTKDFK